MAEGKKEEMIKEQE